MSNTFIYVDIYYRIQEQLRRIRRNEERDRLRQMQQTTTSEVSETVEQPPQSSPPIIPTETTVEDSSKMDPLSDKPHKSVCEMFFRYLSFDKPFFNEASLECCFIIIIIVYYYCLCYVIFHIFCGTVIFCIYQTLLKLIVKVWCLR